MRSEIKPTDSPKPYAEPIAIEPLRQKLERLQSQVSAALMMLDHWRLEPMKFGPGDMRHHADFCVGDFGIFELWSRENDPIEKENPRCGCNTTVPAEFPLPKVGYESNLETLCCHYKAPMHLPYPVFWNPQNRQVQCHNCGRIYIPSF